MTVKVPMRHIFEIKDKKILLINPPVEDFAFFDLWSKPVGLLYLGERLRENGNEVSFIDCIHEGAVGQKTFGREKIRSVEIEKPEVYSQVRRKYHRFGMAEEELVARLSEFRDTDFVFVTSVMTYWYCGLKWLLSVLKRELPAVPCVLGGVYARLCSDHALSLGYDYLATDNWTPDVPYPAMDLYGRVPYGVTMTSFGCPFNCEYCASRLLWPCYKRRPIDEVMREIDFQVKLGAENIAFYDDALLLDKENYFYPMCERIRGAYGESVELHTPNGLHVRQIDKTCASVLMESRFRTIRLSLESIDPKLAGTSSGKVKRDEYAAAVKNLREVGYTKKDCETYILLGLPEQSVESVKETIRFVHDNGGSPKLAEFSPIPGTKSFMEAVVDNPELATEPLLQNNTVYSSWVSHRMSPEVLQELKNFARGW